jgi:hypothetical protein
MEEKPKKKTLKPRKPRTPDYVKEAATTLQEHLRDDTKRDDIDVTPIKEDGEWLLSINYGGETPVRWKGVRTVIRGA